MSDRRTPTCGCGESSDERHTEGELREPRRDAARGGGGVRLPLLADASQARGVEKRNRRSASGSPVPPHLSLVLSLAHCARLARARAVRPLCVLSSRTASEGRRRGKAARTSCFGTNRPRLEPAMPRFFESQPDPPAAQVSERAQSGRARVPRRGTNRASRPRTPAARPAHTTRSQGSPSLVSIAG